MVTKMLDVKIIRERPDWVREALARKGEFPDIDELLGRDRERRILLEEVDSLRHRRNVASEAIAEKKRAGEDASEDPAAVRALASDIKRLEARLKEVDTGLHEALLDLPNIPHESVPGGTDERGNRVVREWATRLEADFPLRTHLEIGASLGILDFPRGAKLAGSAFPLYRGLGARLERALINFMVDLHSVEHGYTEMWLPFLGNAASHTVTGQLPRLADDMYRLAVDDLYLIPTGEVPLTNLHRDEVIAEADLPLKYVGYTACFRREAGAYGKETQGLLRVHQFNKVELVRFTCPEESYEALEALLEEAEEVLKRLELPYRVVELAAGQLSFAAAKCYDIDVWAPAAERWLEVSSCSNFEDFQARRGRIRFRREKTGEVEYVHTLNGSGLATARLMAALLEHYQTEEGTVIVPDVLQEGVGASVLR